MNIGILNYKACNLSSIYNSIYRLGYDPIIIDSSKKIKNLDKLIIPGVGSAKHCLDFIKKNGIFDEINEYLELKKPILGVCLGLQIFSKNLYEHGNSKGFGLINADVLPIDNSNFYNIGWSKLNFNENNNLPKPIILNNIYYFCHSYKLKFNESSEKKYCLGYVENKNIIPAMIIKNNFIGLQFHPEKSQKSGEIIIKYFLDL